MTHIRQYDPDDPWAGLQRDRENIAGDWQRAFGRLRAEEQIRHDLASAAPAEPIRGDHGDPGPSHWCQHIERRGEPLHGYGTHYHQIRPVQEKA